MQDSDGIFLTANLNQHRILGARTLAKSFNLRINKSSQTVHTTNTNRAYLLIPYYGVTGLMQALRSQIPMLLPVLMQLILGQWRKGVSEEVKAKISNKIPCQGWRQGEIFKIVNHIHQMKYIDRLNI